MGEHIVYLALEDLSDFLTLEDDSDDLELEQGIKEDRFVPAYDGVVHPVVDQIGHTLVVDRQQRTSVVDQIGAVLSVEGNVKLVAELVTEDQEVGGIDRSEHAETGYELGDTGGACLAAESRAISADHLDYVSTGGIAAMAASGCTSTKATSGSKCGAAPKPRV